MGYNRQQQKMKKIIVFLVVLFNVITISAQTNEFADLGLSVKWAYKNVGAMSPDGFGSYIAYGELSEQSNGRYDYSSYKWYKNGQYTKYCFDSSKGIVDNKYILDEEDDLATSLGEQWRSPTVEEWKELIQNCEWKQGYVNNVKGYYVCNNGDSIFLPAAGAAYEGGFVYKGRYLFYSSASLDSTDMENYMVMTDVMDIIETGGNGRIIGVPIRPVWGTRKTEDIIHIECNNTIRKEINDGRIFILRGDKTYTIIGAEVK